MTIEEYRELILNRPTPHSAYIRHLDMENAYKLLNSIKSQAMKDYINALAKVRYDPDDYVARSTIRECEYFFEDAAKLETVKRKIKYDGGMFEILCMEIFPDRWGDYLPTKHDMMKCPVCKQGRINRSFRPKDLHAPRKEKKDPRIICSCDVCTYKYTIYLSEKEMNNMAELKRQLKGIALQERERLCREEIADTLLAHPEYTQADIDDVYRKVSAKWKV